uniref:Protein-tyrosine-phosphatase n=1 Tax=Caenorhabditis tropicalis TaxID=1561998 RepID=A0A1I7UWB4_9PELO
MKKLARLINGIYVQNGFIEGSIPPGDFISELFRFGMVTPSDITSMNVKKLQEGLAAFKNLPTDLQKNSNFERIENLFEALEMVMKEIDGLGSIKDWNEKESFKTDIEKLANYGIDFKPIENLQAALNVWIFQNQQLASDTVTDPEALGAFSSLAKQIKAFQTSFSQMPSIAPTVKFAKISSASGALVPMWKAMKGIAQHFLNVAQFVKVAQNVPDYQKNFESLASVNEKLKDSMKDLRSLNSLVNSRSAFNHSLKFTNGFLEGAEDIKLIFEDLKDPWIQSIIGERDLSKALNPLIQLEHHSSNIEKSLKSSINSSDFQAISSLVGFVNRIFVITEGRNDIVSSITAIDSCGFIPPSPVKNTTLVELVNNSTQIDRLMTDMKVFLKKLTVLVTDPKNTKMLEEVLIITEEATKLETVKTVLGEYKKYENSNDLNKFIGEVNQLVADFSKPIDKPKKLKELAEGVKSNFGALDSYHQDFQQHSEYFLCLQNHKNLKLVFNGVSTVKEFRDMSGSLNGFEKVISDMKGSGDSETASLQQLENSEKHSKVIGSATRGITAMKETISQKRVDLNVDLISSSMNNLFPPLDQHDVETLSKVINLKSEIEGVYNSLDHFQSSVHDLKSTSLSDHYDVFEKAEKVIGINSDGTEMADSVGKLIERVTDPTEKSELKASKTELEGISALQFSKYNQDFKDTRGSLETVDTFFSSLISSNRQSQSIPKQKLLPESMESSSAPPPTNSGTNYLALFGYSLLGVICILFILYLFYRCFFKNTTVEIHEEDEGDNRIGTSTPATNLSTLESQTLTPLPKTMNPDPKTNPDSKDSKINPTSKTNPDSKTKPDSTEKPPIDSGILNSNAADSKTTDAKITKQKNPVKPKTNEPNKTNPLEKQSLKQSKDTKLTPQKAENYILNIHQNMEMCHKQNPVKNQNDTYVKVFCQLFKSIFLTVANKISNETDFQKKFRDEYRFATPLADGTKVELKNEKGYFKTNFIHANFASFGTGPGIIVCQAPSNTGVAKFFWMAKEQGTTDIFLLSTIHPAEQYYPDLKDESKQFDMVKITCESREDLNENAYIIRKLKVEFKGEPSFNINLHQYVKWADRLAPKDPTIVNQLRAKMRTNRTRSIVHCTDGVGRSGCIIMMELIYDKICSGTQIAFDELMRTARETRSNAIETPIQLAFCVYAVAKEVTSGISLNKKSQEYMTDIQDGYLRFCENENELARQVDQTGDSDGKNDRKVEQRLKRIVNGKDEPAFQLNINCSLLEFKYISTEPAYAYLKITNTKKERQAFYTNTTNSMYKCQPPFGLIEPGEDMHMKVTYKNETRSAPVDGDRRNVKISHAKAGKAKTYKEIIALKPEGIIHLFCNHLAEIIAEE